MNTIELCCPHCGAIIHAEEDLASFECPCCGSTIVLYEQSDAPSVRSALIGEMVGKPMPPKKRKSPLRSVVAAVLSVAVIGGAGYLGILKYTEKEIETCEKKVQEYIDTKDFSRAMTQLSSFDGHCFFKTRWESKKEALVQEIGSAVLSQQQAQQEQETAQSQKASYEVPLSPKDAQNEYAVEIKSRFEAAHFKNVHLEPITIVDAKEAEKAEDKKVISVRITVDGKEVYPEKGDLLRANAEITILFYDFSNSARVPMSSKDAIGMKYIEVETCFEDAKFHVICEEYKEEQEAPVVEGLKKAWNWAKKPFTKPNSGTVQAITIKYNEEIKSDFGEGARVPSDATVTITYFK